MDLVLPCFHSSPVYIISYFYHRRNARNVAEKCFVINDLTEVIQSNLRLCRSAPLTSRMVIVIPGCDNRSASTAASRILSKTPFGRGKGSELRKCVCKRIHDIVVDGYGSHVEGDEFGFVIASALIAGTMSSAFSVLLVLVPNNPDRYALCRASLFRDWGIDHQYRRQFVQSTLFGPRSTQRFER